MQQDFRGNGAKAGHDDCVEEFLGLFAKHQQTILIYLTSLLERRGDVDDLFQETSLVCWREFANFEPGTNFGAWACTIAFNRVRAWRKQQARNSVRFGDEFVEAIAAEIARDEFTADARSLALRECIKRLPQHHRELVRLRYQAEKSIESLAEELGRSHDSIYRMLSRIRQSLHDCVVARLQGESP